MSLRGEQDSGTIGPAGSLAASPGPPDNRGMTAELRAEAPHQIEGSVETGVDDQFLVASIVGGDPAALRRLLGRYDRLVRYTIFQASQQRCRDDPQWLDSVASATWSGFIASLNRTPDNPPSSIPGYLARIARNQAISALRRKTVQTESLDAQLDEAAVPAGDDASPLAILAQIEDLELLRSCVASVSKEDAMLLGHLEAITGRRWRDAAVALDMPESTLRSRWGRLLDRLRVCMSASMEKGFAPRSPVGD